MCKDTIVRCYEICIAIFPASAINGLCILVLNLSRIKNQESRIKNQESRIKDQVSSIKNQELRIKNQDNRITYNLNE